MKYLFVILLSLFTFSVYSQKEIKIEDAASHIGDSVKICSKIYSGKFLETAKGSPTFLNLGGAYPNALLTIVIWDTSRKNFKTPPEELYAGKDVCISGKIELFRDKPQIVVTDPSQIVDLSPK